MNQLIRICLVAVDYDYFIQIPELDSWVPGKSSEFLVLMYHAP